MARRTPGIALFGALALVLSLPAAGGTSFPLAPEVERGVGVVAGEGLAGDAVGREVPAAGRVDRESGGDSRTVPLVVVDAPFPVVVEKFRRVGAGAGAALDVELAHRGAGGDVTAWTVTLRQVVAGDAPPPLALRSRDATLGGSDSALLRPGERSTVRFALPPATPELLRLEVEVTAVVMDDLATYGAGYPLAHLLERRVAADRERERWSRAFRTAVEDAGSPEAARRAVAALRSLLAEAGERDSGAGDAVFVRRELLADLDYVEARAAREPAEAARFLEEVAGELDAALAAGRRHTPAPAAVSGLDSVYAAVGEQPPPGDEEKNCECGGSMDYSPTQNESINCKAGDGWRVAETWHVSCWTENNQSAGTKTGFITGIGGCRTGYFCTPDTYCPPLFSGPSYSVDDTYHYMQRSVSNQVAYIGTCWARCDSHPSKPLDSLTMTCGCAPPPSPLCDYDPNTPLLVDLGRGGFELTGLADGVRFDLDVDGHAERVSWTAAGGDDAWLALDRDGDGMITSGRELFGARTDQPPSPEANGYLALAVFDRPEEGGDGDGWITAGDAIFGSLRLWLDADRDGVSDPGELRPLADHGVAGLDLDYWESRRRDRHGNEYKLLSHVQMQDGKKRRSTDVYLLMED